MLNHLPFSRYDVSIRTRDVVRSDYTKNYPNVYEDNIKMWKGSTTINLHNTKNFNPHKLVEYAEHPHRYIEQTKTSTTTSTTATPSSRVGSRTEDIITSYE